MKILIVTHEFYPKGSGIARHTYHLRLSMEKLGHKVDICSPSGPDIIVSKTEKAIERLGGFGIVWFWFKSGKILHERLAEYDAVFLQNPMLFRRVPKGKIHCIVHSLFFFVFRDSDWKRLPLIPYYMAMSLIERISYFFLKGHHFIVTSPKTIKELKAYGINQKIPIIYNGFDFSVKGKALKNKIQFDPFKRHLLYAGRLAYNKNIGGLLKVFSKLRQLDKSFELTIVPGREEPFNHIQCPPGVRILGGISHEELLEIYKGCDFFISASKYEGFPLTLSEACASGLIPILSPLEVFKHVRKVLGIGLIVDFDSKNAAEKIRNFCLKTTKRDKRHVAKVAKRVFNWDIIAEEYISFATAHLNKSP